MTVESPRRGDELRLRLGVHDLSRIEWTASVPLPASGSERYEVQFTVDIPSTMLPTHSVWEHLQIFTRLQSPAEEGPLAIERHDVEELRRGTLGVAHRLKQLHSRFERACAAEAARPDATPEAALRHELDEVVTQAVGLIADLRRQLGAGEELAPELGRECALADEFLSHALIDVFAGCERAIDEVLFGPRSRLGEAAPWSEVLRARLAEALADELGYRRGRGWIVPRADAPAELSHWLERTSRLKKHFQDVLYLDVTAYFVDTRLRNVAGVIAAALAAMMWLAFTLLPIGQGTRAGIGVGTFAVLFAVAYAIKDRLKELTRGWLTRRVMELYGQRVVALKLPARIDPARSLLLDTRESFDVESQPPSDAGDALGAPDLGRPRRVMRLSFRMRAVLHAAPPLARAHIDSIKHIFRYDLSPIFSRLDDAVKQVPVLDANRRVRFADAPKEYRFPARIVFRPHDGPALEHQADLVLSKRGIERVEPRQNQ